MIVSCGACAPASPSLPPSIAPALNHRTDPGGGRLWAATGQAALESSRILVLSASATATSILKNLVLPGIGHFTILDPHTATPADAGVNFFLNGHASVGRPRAEEAVRLLAELNDGVEGRARVADPADVLNDDPAFFSAFSLVIAHNLRADALARLAALLWADPARAPLVVVRSAGFLAEFYVQYHEHDGARVFVSPAVVDRAPRLTRGVCSHREPRGDRAVAAHRQAVPRAPRVRPLPRL